MKLLTKQILNNFSKYPLYSQSGVEPKVIIAKFFGGCACTWYITEADKEGDDWRMYGWCDLGLGYPEWGYVMFSEIASIKFPPFGLPAERDYSFDTMQYRINIKGEVSKVKKETPPPTTTVPEDSSSVSKCPLTAKKIA